MQDAEQIGGILAAAAAAAFRRTTFDRFTAGGLC